MLSVLLQILFWLCIAAMLHTYVTYPLTLRLLRRRFLPPDVPAGAWPTAALLIPAYNEEKVIAEKIRNALDLDYDAGRLEILVGSDGSTDRTNDIVRGLGDPRVRLIELRGRNGKPQVINRLASETGADVLVISDANVRLDPLALRKLLRHFVDPAVGVVNGGKYIQIPRGAEAVMGEAVYGDLENRLRARESEVGGMSGALGALMAIRRSVFEPYRPGVICDDLDISIRAVLSGYRQAHDSDAKAFEEPGRTVAQEFHRRIRIGAGNFQALFRYGGMLSPLRGVVAYTYFSHKVVRWVFPFLMIGALVAATFLQQTPVYRTALLAQLVLYGLALMGLLLDCFRLRVPLISTLYHFVALNAALFLGFFVWCRGVRSSAWERTERMKDEG